MKEYEGLKHFNPRSPHGERRRVPKSVTLRDDFNPRSPHGERRNACKRRCIACKFQPTLPARGATFQPIRFLPLIVISTHAPRTGSDSAQLTATITPSDFNPRSPHGERLIDTITACARHGFQPTLPARGATCPDDCSL